MAMKLMRSDGHTWSSSHWEGGSGRTLEGASLKGQGSKLPRLGLPGVSNSNWSFSSLDAPQHIVGSPAINGREDVGYESDQTGRPNDQPTLRREFRPPKRDRSPSLECDNSQKRRRSYNSPSTMSPSQAGRAQRFFENYHRQDSEIELIREPNTGLDIAPSPARYRTGLREEPAPIRARSYAESHPSYDNPSIRLTPSRNRTDSWGQSLQESPRRAHRHGNSSYLRQTDLEEVARSPSKNHYTRHSGTPYDNSREREELRQRSGSYMPPPQSFRERYEDYASSGYRRISPSGSQNMPPLTSMIWADRQLAHMLPSRDSSRPSSPARYSDGIRMPSSHIMRTANASQVQNLETFNISEFDEQLPHVRDNYVPSTHGVVSIHQDGRSVPRTPTTPVRPRHDDRNLHSGTTRRLHGQHRSQAVPGLPNLIEVNATSMESLIHQHERRFANVEQSPYDPSKVLPSRSIYDNERGISRPNPPPVRSKPRPVPPTSTSSLGSCSENAINLATPEATSRDLAPTRLKKSIPMKQRLGPPVLRGTAAKNPIPSRAPTKITTIPQKVKTPVIDVEQARQRRAANLVIQKEIEAENKELEKAIFGEIVGDNSFEQQERLEQKRLEVERRKEEKAKQVAAQAEANRLAEEEKRLLEDKNAEHARIRRMQDQEMKEARLVAERRKQVLIDNEIMEEKRQKALEKITADRALHQAAIDSKALEKEKARTIQVEGPMLEEIKLRQEAAKLQAASLKSASIFPPDNSKLRNAPFSVNSDDEETLFITEKDDRKEIYDVDERSRVKLEGPTSAQEFVANTLVVWPGRISFREERENFERNRKVEEQKQRNANCAQKLVARKMAQYDAAGSRSFLPASKPAKKRPTAKNLKNVSVMNTSEKIDIVTDSNKRGVYPGTDPTESGPPAEYISVPLPVLKPAIKPATSKRPKDRSDEKRKERAEATRRKARAKLEADHKQDSKAAGYDLTEDEVRKWVDIQMKKRDDIQRRRAENKALKEGRRESQGSNATDRQQLLSSGESCSGSHTLELFGDDPDYADSQEKEEEFSKSHDDQPHGTNDQIQTSPNQRTDVSASKEKMIAMASTKRYDNPGRFAKLPRNVTVQQFPDSESDSDESEEDPDDEATLEAHRQALQQASKPVTTEYGREEKTKDKINYLEQKEVEADEEELGESVFCVTAETLPTSQISGCDATKIKPRVSKNAWKIICTVSTGIIDKATGKSMIKESIQQLPPRYTALYTDSGLANSEACQFLFHFLKPDSQNIDDAEMHENNIAPGLRGARDQANDEGQLFDVSLDMEYIEQVHWLLAKKFTAIQVQVEQVFINGPLN